MDLQALAAVLNAHAKWLVNDGGTRANLTRANLTDANLTRADLTGANLTDANLTRANLTDANLTRAYLSSANLSGADLTGADLTGADLTRAYLSDADLTRANLSGANLPGANLSGANLADANLSGAEIPKIENLDQKILEAIAGGGSLNMQVWHTCETTHCRAGWAITLAGEAGQKLEAKYGPSAAGALIYAVAYPGRRIPNFFATNDNAMADIQARAAGTQ